LRHLRDVPDFAKLAEDATTPVPLYPELTRALVDAWSMTSLDDHPGRPDVSPWLRGWVDDEPQTQLLWRRHLPIRPGESRAAAMRALDAFFEDAPPHLSETLETYTYRAVEFLRARAKAVLKVKDDQTSDVAHDDEADTVQASELRSDSLVAVVLGQDRKVDRLLTLKGLADTEAKQFFATVRNRTLVLDCRLGGLDDTGLLNPKQGRLPTTLDGDPPVEIHEGVGSSWSGELLEEIGFRIRRTARNTSASNHWKIVHRRYVDEEDEESGDLGGVEWRIENWVGERGAPVDPALANENQALQIHHDKAALHAGELARRLALPPSTQHVLVEAARYHDLGKMRKNWQAYAGNSGYPERPREREPLAKFSTRGNPALLKIGELTYRHEFGSLRDAIERKLFDDLEPGFRDDALHAIAAHHGNARPTIAPADPASPPSSSAELSHDAAMRFERMQAKWGPWRLAWWEALLRASDVAASKEVTKPEGEA
jgi:CRISPR-associated endonuclease/helicase Cas3